MKTRLVRVGNSWGVRLPKAIIVQAGLTDQVELAVRGGIACCALIRTHFLILCYQLLSKTIINRQNYLFWPVGPFITINLISTEHTVPHFLHSYSFSGMVSNFFSSNGGHNDLKRELTIGSRQFGQITSARKEVPATLLNLSSYFDISIIPTSFNFPECIF